MLYQVLIVIYLLVAIALIGFVLIQQGKGADMGASFGAGSSATIFGSSGSGNFMTKVTTMLAIAFFVISLILGNLTANKVKATDEWNDLSSPAVQTESVPAASAEPGTANEDVPASSDKAEDNNDVPN